MHHRKRSYFEGVDCKIGSKHRDTTPAILNPSRYEGPPMIDCKAFKQEFLAGDKDVVLYCDKNAAKVSSYAANLKGRQPVGDYLASILDFNRTSFVGNTIPDPATLGKYFFLTLTSR